MGGGAALFPLRGGTTVMQTSRPRNTQRGKNMKTPHWLAVTCFTLIVASCSPRNQEARQGQEDAKNVDAPWLNQVAGMPAEKQAEAVAARLTELNPGCTCKLTHKVEKG